MLGRAAPGSPLGCGATMPRSTSATGLLRVWTSRIFSRPATSGGATKTWRSKRPGGSSAGSSLSSRFEAGITTMSPRAEKQRAPPAFVAHVGARHRDDACAGRETVHLDQQLVERLVALAGDVAAA